jgi:hypothetical protein
MDGIALLSESHPAGAAEPTVMENFVNSNLAQKRVYSDLERTPSVRARSSGRSALSEPGSRLSIGGSLVAILLSSLGLWAVIWAVAASLT